MARPVPPWALPLDGDELRSVLSAVRRWQPFDGVGLLDDVGAVLDDVVPPEEALEDHALRLRGHLMQLVAIAVAAEAGQKDTETERLIEHARWLRAQDMPGDHHQAVGHLRRMAWSVDLLHERLGALKCIREAA
ncbi:DUF6415 family natural product biosynthesis protein [Streptomyces rhizosphaerihabitans]|uniref:DUF6415 family natural product biosynthesis protein n=1 Tax=Streptomyces rhizosphaerihabitans TaxID=1266770 RepID=UPI0021C17280|nr:DUF6415 family natural product biosynthesis protein [Streptomyces rhizosphaerihabitans]MCT9010324.1 DUF6415 family natural product biosynthesis protein [Streptomyces rhizosphaerihabitans]